MYNGLSEVYCIKPEGRIIPLVYKGLKDMQENNCNLFGGVSKPYNSDFYQNNFLSTREYQTHGAHSVEFS